MRRFARIVVCAGISVLVSWTPSFSAEWNSFSYEDFDEPQTCGACHREIFREFQMSMMAESYTHHWDEIEYFKLALPQAKKLEKVSGVKEGCIGCHSPLAFLSGDTPPPVPSAGSRANEGVTCEVCHNINGSTEPEPFNFSFVIDPGPVKYGPRKDAVSTYHQVEHSEFLQSAEFCATCHDEQSPYGMWVKSTYREWKAGPYPTMNIECQDCHMHRAPGEPAVGGPSRDHVAHHVFQGAHNPSKLAGAVDVAIYAEKEAVSPGDDLSLDVVLFNAKAGHMIPTGSTEERQVWLNVEAIDAAGGRHHIPVTLKGFTGEEYTVTSHELSYQAIGEIMEIEGFKGLSRDGDDLPEGDRIFRRPFFDPKGRMTICQWYTADNELVDYRIGPRETKIEHFSWKLPDDLPRGALTVEAAVNYRLLPSSVAKHLGVPEEEYETVLINKNAIELEVL